MKILHINSYFSTGDFYKNFYDKQIENNINIDVFVPVSKSFHTDRDLGDYSFISRCYSQIDRYSFYVKQYKILKSIQNNFEIDSYDVIHAHSLFTNGYIAYKLNQKYGIPYILAVRNTDVNIFFKKMFHLRSIGIKILNNARSIIFLSNSYKDEVLDKYIPLKYMGKISKKIVLLPNGIDNFWIENRSSKDKNEPSDALKLLHVGDININKNLTTTVKAIKLLMDKGFKVQYTVVGKVKDNRLYNELKKEKFIKFIAPVLKEELITLYRSNDIFVMPSLKETFGLVYAEAMSQALPIIYSKGQGFDGQFADGEVGYSVDCNSPIDIANKISEIIKNYETISSNSFSKVKKFNWEDINEKYLKIYSKVIKG